MRLKMVLDDLIVITKNKAAKDRIINLLADRGVHTPTKEKFKHVQYLLRLSGYKFEPLPLNYWDIYRKDTHIYIESKTDDDTNNTHLFYNRANYKSFLSTSSVFECGTYEDFLNIINKPERKTRCVWW
jgi:hypothetical protein